MKKSDFIFWGVLGIIALFLLLKGNDVHRDYYKHIAEKAKQSINVQSGEKELE